jgi:antitoxin (DNA-binding transcriptional repressor) of toxin-antitoxin stability system
MVQYMTMKMVNIFEAKAKLSEYVEAAASGERVLICKRNQPVAELRAVPGARTAPRPVGGAAGRLHVPPAFFDPLPDDVLSSFSPDDALAPSEAERPARTAERPPAYRARPSKKRRR